MLIKILNTSDTCYVLPARVIQSAEILILSCFNRCLLSVLSSSIPGWKIETLKNYQLYKNDVFKNLVSTLPSGPLSGLLRNVITRVDVLPNIFQVKKSKVVHIFYLYNFIYYGRTCKAFNFIGHVLRVLGG